MNPRDFSPIGSPAHAAPTRIPAPQPRQSDPISQALNRFAPIHLDDSCWTCRGTGEGQNEYVSCWKCHGRGWTLEPRDMDDFDEPSEA